MLLTPYGRKFWNELNGKIVLALAAKRRGGANHYSRHALATCQSEQNKQQNKTHSLLATETGQPVSLNGL